MNPDLLQSFLAVADSLNFTRAAESLALSQPGVSRQVRQLERDLGVVLFERLGRSVQLTDAGRELVPLAEQLLGQIERAVEAVRAHGSVERGRLRIGASTTPGLYLLPRILGRFRRAHPGVELQFMVENSIAIQRRILKNELDIGFVGARSTDGALHAVPILKDEIICFGPGSTVRRARQRVPITAIRDATWIVREKGSATRELFERWFAKSGAKMAHVIELDSPEGIKSLVRAGVGISFLSIHAVAAELRRGELGRINLADLRLSRAIYLVRHPDKHISPVITGFLDLLAGMRGTRA